MGVVIPQSARLGHNYQPDILEPTLVLEQERRKAQEAALRPPSREMCVRWARRAGKLGLTYREFRLVLLEHGRYPTDEGARRIATLGGVPAVLADV
jgi:hypothetical protein